MAPITELHPEMEKYCWCFGLKNAKYVVEVCLFFFSHIDALIANPKRQPISNVRDNLAFNRELIGPAMYFELMMGWWPTHWQI